MWFSVNFIFVISVLGITLTIHDIMSYKFYNFSEANICDVQFVDDTKYRSQYGLQLLFESFGDVANIREMLEHFP
jgi:hypothetical protein